MTDVMVMQSNTRGRMMMRKSLRELLGCCAVIGMVMVPSITQASGQLPNLPSSDVYPSREACVAALEQQWTHDRAQVSPEQRLADGRIRRITLETRGIEQVDATTTRYAATLWYSYGVDHTDTNQREFSSTYERRNRVCAGATMQTDRIDGYTSSSFGPITPVPDAPAAEAAGNDNATTTTPTPG